MNGVSYSSSFEKSKIIALFNDLVDVIIDTKVVSTISLI